MQMNGETDRHDKANSCFSQFCKVAKKWQSSEVCRLSLPKLEELNHYQTGLNASRISYQPEFSRLAQTFNFLKCSSLEINSIN
jgi:hypothetical protein